MQLPKLIKNYIDGKLCAPIDDNYIDNINPATGKVYSHIPLSNKNDLDKAISGAKSAFSKWSNSGTHYRMTVLLKLANLIKENEDFLAKAESLDNGKPLHLAKSVDIPRAHDNIHFFATAIQHFASEAHHMENKAINYTLRRPIGVVGCISPWNLPLYLFTWKIAPALAAGNCVIAKPSEVTPMTAYLLSELCIEAGLPKGVLNILHGTGASIGQEIVAHPEIKAISFTGGTTTGQTIAKTAAPMFKKLSLELGGKNPNIIFNDADMDKAVNLSVKAAFTNQGQICLCGSRIYIQDDIYETFKQKFVDKVNSLRVGNPLHKDTTVGAVVSEAHYNKVLNHIKTAKEEGGRILTGGRPIHLDGELSNGFYIEPTVIDGLNDKCTTNQDEIFGPVVSLNRFKTEEEVIQLANSSKYGLSATIFTKDLEKAHRVAEKIEAGIVWINTWLLRDLRTPFGGTKSSGVGREGGFEALRFFTEPKNICIKY